MYLLLLFLFLPVIYGIYYLQSNIQFGGKITANERKKMQQSSHWHKNKFINLEKTGIDISIFDIPKLLFTFIKGNKNKRPQKPLAILPFDKEKFTADLKPKFVWYGHSAVLLQLDGKNILIDPMFGQDCSPVGPVRSWRFSQNTLAIIDQLPPIDIVLLTHDHYDHLDYNSIQKLLPKTQHFIVGLGIAKHLVLWGADQSKITELDWWQNKTIENISIDYTPSRHFAGRGLTDRARSFWGGFVIKSKQHQVFWSGDGGYGAHFKEIGKKYGAFDIAFVECGQYNEKWKQVHMLPEESAQVAEDVNAQKVVAVHWGGFSLAPHAWQEPIQRFTQANKNKNAQSIQAQLGEIIYFTENYCNTDWWNVTD